MATSAQTLITTATAAGYDALSDRQLKEALLVAAQAGGGGGGGTNDSQGTVNPTAAPSNPALPGYYTNLTTGTIFTWNVTNQAWQ